jgi:hypothetical protein
MFNPSEIREHDEVVASDGVHVGTVDRIEGGRIKLTKADSVGEHAGHHHYIPFEAIDRLEEGRVVLTGSRDEAVFSEQEESGVRVQ